MCLNAIVRHFPLCKCFSSNNEEAAFLVLYLSSLMLEAHTFPPLVFLQCMYLLLHTVKGTPFETPDQGKARLLTHWEQMDYGVQFTASRKFLTITPIVL